MTFKELLLASNPITAEIAEKLLYLIGRAESTHELSSQAIGEAEEAIIEDIEEKKQSGGLNYSGLRSRLYQIIGEPLPKPPLRSKRRFSTPGLPVQTPATTTTPIGKQLEFGVEEVQPIVTVQTQAVVVPTPVQETTQTVQRFDFAALDPETRIVVQQEDKEFDMNMSDSGSAFIRACGNVKRIHAKLKYKRPGFVDWCNSKDGLSQQTANKMLNVAEMLPQYSNIQIESKAALYLFASPSTPEEARVEILERADKGETITHAKAKEIVEEKRPKKEPKNVEAKVTDKIAANAGKTPKAEPKAEPEPAEANHNRITNSWDESSEDERREFFRDRYEQLIAMMGK